MNLFRAVLDRGPLAWHRWGPDALREARERDLPLLVFCGDALDAWSAGMAGELIADREACDLIGEAFVPVAAEPLDDPALAARVQQALGATAGAAGWPACAVCTPDGLPFGAVPWRPIRDREREAGLVRILVGVAEQWSGRRADCIADAERLRDLLRRLGQGFAEGRPLAPAMVLDAAEAAAMAVADPLEGGFGPAPRRLDPALLRFLVARAARADAPLALTKQVERTLAGLCASAVHDQLAGGFHRGSADAAGHEPFFAKRLADQAAMALVLFDADAAFGQRLYRDLAERTLHWCVHALRRADGTYAAGVHAASAAGDGAPYTWTLEQAAAVVGRDGAERIARRFGLDDTPRALAVVAPLADDDAERLPALLQRLAVARAERPQPPRDERLDPGAHGALLAAFAHARRLPGRDRALLAHGRALFRTLRRWATRPPFAHGDGAVARRTGDLAAIASGVHAWRAGAPGRRGPRPGWARGWAEDWLSQQLAHCGLDGSPGLFRVQAANREALLDPPPLAAEDSTDLPSGAALLAHAALDLGRREDAARIVDAHRGLLRAAPLSAPGLCLALHRLHAG